MQKPPISQAEIDKRLAPHLDELLALWWAEQGAGKPNDLALMAHAIPFPRDRAIRVLDLCCGPGDVGRSIHKVFPKAQIDGVDRDPFLMSIARAVNVREKIPGTLVVRDLEESGLQRELAGPYDVVATVNAIHWFDERRAKELLAEVRGVLRKGGVFLIAEPVSPDPAFASGFEEWKQIQPARYSRENWQKFWFRGNEILRYDHIALLGSRDDEHIGDSLTVAGWAELIRASGFMSVDVLLRDADQVIVGAVAP
jgi:SAM-dependent methyltransferase